jgi:pimeloyl-ACP methyl ester carboxylesterase
MTEPTVQTITLPDGRKLAYAEYGDPDGKPILYCHGNPGSRLDPKMMDQELVRKFHARILAPDRPGMGGSDFQPGRKMSDWPADAAALMNGLHLDRFAVLGISGGGPYAEVCALKIPDRLTVAVVASGVGPLEAPNATQGMGQGRFYLKAARLQPWLAEAFLGMMKAGMKNARMDKMPGMPPEDLQVLACPEVGQALLESSQESWQNGLKGTAWDATIAARPWDFRLEEIRMPVHLWQGEADRNVPAAMARYVAGKIPDCRAHFYPNEGHISLLAHHLEEILEVLVG